MNEYENRPNQHVNQNSSRTGRRWVIAAVVTSVIAVLSVAGTSFAGEKMGQFCEHSWHKHHEVTPEEAAKHIDKMVARLLADGTAEQKTKVTEIANAAFKDIYPLRVQHHAARDQVAHLLTQATIDRAALEQIRGDELRLAEQVSKRITEAVADAAEVLTLEQRVKLAEHIKQHFKEHMG